MKEDEVEKWNELLLEQQEFFKKNIKPSAKAINKRKKIKNENIYEEVNYTNNNFSHVNKNIVKNPVENIIYNTTDEIKKAKNNNNINHSFSSISKLKEHPIEKARFDFEGNILSYEQQISLPTYFGLHHHGIQPECAGYSLEEIFLLIRSSIPSQRTINIQILSKIIKKADSNQFLIYGIDDIVEYLINYYNLPKLLEWILTEKNQTNLMTGLELLYMFVNHFQRKREKLKEIESPQLTQLNEMGIVKKLKYP